VPYKKILCPIGHEENSRAAFETAARLARESHATLYLVHIVPLPTSTLAEGAVAGDRERARKALEMLAAQLPPALDRVIIVTFGNPVREIIEVAHRIGADLIVMGTHGRTMMARLFQGSIAEKVIGAAPCPVLTLPPDALAEASDTASQAA
jgi:nucleotide-binding universal stress UspA family protein